MNSFTAEIAQMHFTHWYQHLIQMSDLQLLSHMLNYLQQFSNPKAHLSILNTGSKFDKIINPETK
jgi:hypothetical protein